MHLCIGWRTLAGLQVDEGVANAEYSEWLASIGGSVLSPIVGTMLLPIVFPIVSPVLSPV